MRTAHCSHNVFSVWKAHATAAAASASADRAASQAGRRFDTSGADAGGADSGGEDGFGGGDWGGFGDDGDGDYGGGEGGAAAGAAEAAGQLLQAAAAASGMLGVGGLQLGGDQDGLFALLQAPRRVQRVDVNYDKVAKVVHKILVRDPHHRQSTIHALSGAGMIKQMAMIAPLRMASVLGSGCDYQITQYESFYRTFDAR